LVNVLVFQDWIDLSRTLDGTVFHLLDSDSFQRILIGIFQEIRSALTVNSTKMLRPQPISNYLTD